MKALVLVDLQNDFCPGGALAVKGGDEVIAIANQVQSHFDLVVATQDWHPADHGSFAVNNEGYAVGDLINLGGQPQMLWPRHCVAGTPGAEFVAGLDRDKIAMVFPKGTDPEIDSYSGFYDNGHLKATGLATYLREKAVNTVYIMGLATDYCVKYTVMDARDEGFEVFLIEDGCRGVDLAPGDAEEAIEDLRGLDVAIITSGQIGS